MMDELDELRMRVAEKRGWSKFETLKSTGRLLGKSPEGKWYDTVPDWPHDIGAAFTLLDESREAGYRAGLWMLKDGWNCVIVRPVNIGEQTVAEAQGSTAPEAICRAWLAWMEEQ